MTDVPVFSPPTVAGLRVLITGASGGIGKATSLLLASGGAKVALLDFLEPTPLATEINSAFGAGTALSVSCDVRLSESVEGAIKHIVGTWGAPLDAAVNLAGVIGKGRKYGTTEGQLMDMEDVEWYRLVTSVRTQPCAPKVDNIAADITHHPRVVDINLNGVMNCMRAELRHFNPRGGHIVSAASVAGQEGVPFNAAYGASKSGVISLTKSVAKEVASRNIRVNGDANIQDHSGVVDTSMISSIANDEAKKLFAKRMALGRFARPEEIAKLIFWLISDYNTFATGSVSIS